MLFLRLSERKNLLNGSIDCFNLMEFGREFHSLAPRYEKLFLKLSVFGFWSAKLKF